MNFNHLLENSKVSYSEERAAINIFVVLLFLLLNPLYAISICAVLNLVNSRINFRLFLIMFALSFASFYFLRDWNIGSDAIHYVRSYQAADSISLSDIFHRFVLKPQGGELFFYTYIWLFRKLFGYHVDFFAFFNYFLIFSLTAYLGKAVDRKRFAVVTLCIIFVDSGLLGNAFEVWRHTIAALLFLIGIFLFETNKHRRLSRSLMYSSALFHLVTLPLVILYEFFTFFSTRNKRLQTTNPSQRIKWNSIGIITYVIFMVLVFNLIEKYGVFIAPYFNLSSLYKWDIFSVQRGFNFIFNWLFCALVAYFWLNRKKISKNDLFIIINYYIIVYVMMRLDFPGYFICRIWLVFKIGIAILYAKLLLIDLDLGIIGCLGIIVYTFHFLFTRPGGGIKLLSLLGGGDFLNPTYGLAVMIYNYGTFLVSPSTVLQSFL